MATHPSILSWRISWTGEPSRLQSMGSQRVVMIEQLTLSIRKNITIAHIEKVFKFKE